MIILHLVEYLRNTGKEADMYKNSTTDLNHRLLDPSGTGREEIVSPEDRIRSGKELLDVFISSENEISPADIVRSCQGYLSRSYIYDILSGKREAPSRDVVIMISLALKTDVKSAGRLLKAFGHRDLYPRDPRDLEVMQCMTEGVFEISEVNDRLSAGGYRLLGE